MRYVLAHQQKDGGFEPIGAMSYYMVIGASLLYTGHGEAASKLMPFIARTFVADNGSFDMPEVREGNAAEPDWELLTALVERAGAPVVLEGRVWTPEQARRALELGAFAVVVGTAITRPTVIARRFVEELAKGPHDVAHREHAP